MRVVLVFLVLFGTACFAQINKQTIINSGKYYYGSGISDIAKEARARAIEELTSQIAVRVASDFETKINIKGAADAKEEVKSILRTHSLATLHNVSFINSTTDDGSINVFCYLLKSEAAKIFETRRKLVFDFFSRAREYEQDGNFGEALKLYYFSIVLLNSIPNQVVMFDGLNLITELPSRITKIILGTRFSLRNDRLISDKEREITLAVSVNGKKAYTLNFTFWDGSKQIEVKTRDGLATLRLLGSFIDKEELNIKIDYAFYEARDEYKAVKDLWDLVARPRFDCRKTVPLKKDKIREIIPDISDASDWNFNLEYKSEVPVAREIKNSTARFLALIAKGDMREVKAAYADDPFLQKKVADYMRFNHPKALDENIRAAVEKTNAGFELRKIRMLHNYPSINKQSTEYLVLDFSEQGKLKDLNLSITENLYNHLKKAADISGDWANRQAIIKFVEKYRTAYMTRDIKTVGLMFAEDALILIGRKIERKEFKDQPWKYRKLGKQPDYQYLRLKKSAYLKRLAAIFRAQQDIFLGFGSFDIFKKNSKREIYGVQMRQHYNSTTYADEGYLFLLIDFTEEDPLIYVRAWQPNEWSKEALVDAANFKIH